MSIHNFCAHKGDMMRYRERYLYNPSYEDENRPEPGDHTMKKQVKIGCLSFAALMIWAVSNIVSADSLYPKFDVGSTAPPEVTRDIEKLIGEFGARWSSREWRTVLDLWDPDEKTPYYLFSHQPDWLIGWDQLNGYFAEKQTVPVKAVSELNPVGMQQIELAHYEYRNEKDLEAMLYTPDGIRVRKIAPDLALAVWYVKFQYKPYYLPAMGESFKANAVFRNTKDGWKFIHYAETPDSAIMYFERLYRQQATPEFIEMTSRKKSKQGRAAQ
jgi:hypothetical protein